MNICLLGSGSKGNCLYVESRGAALIVDQGFSYREFAARMQVRGLDPGRVRGILVTHEHSDHIAGVGVTARKLGIPVYATRGTFAGKRDIFNGGETLTVIEGGAALSLAGMDVLPFTVSHDANEPVQYRISAGKLILGVATDLGFVSTLVEHTLCDSDLLVLESNHDVEMLRRGPYPWNLKQRIMGRTGHLSNRNAAELLFNLCQRRPVRAILAHLSEENNSPDLAEREVRELFESYDKRLASLDIALQDEPTPVIEV